MRTFGKKAGHTCFDLGSTVGAELSFFLSFLAIFPIFFLFVSFNSSALAPSDNNQHNDSQTYCDALFIFYLWLITRYQLTTFTLKCVWITSGEDCKGGGGGGGG